MRYTGYYSFTYCGHNVELIQFTDNNGYGKSWFIDIDHESAELEPRALLRDAKAAAIKHIEYMPAL